MKTILCLFALVAISACPALASPSDHPTGPGISKVDSPPVAPNFLFEHTRARYLHAAESIPFREPVIVIREIPVDHIESLFCPDAQRVRPDYSAENDLVYRKQRRGYFVERRPTCGAYGWQESAAG